MAVTLWLVTIWIPYLNIGTTIAFITFVVMFVLFVLAASIAMAIEASLWNKYAPQQAKDGAGAVLFYPRPIILSKNDKYYLFFENKY